MLANIFRGAKTGKTQVSLLQEGLVPKILIPDETDLIWTKSEER